MANKQTDKEICIGLFAQEVIRAEQLDKQRTMYLTVSDEKSSTSSAMRIVRRISTTSVHMLARRWYASNST